MLQTIIVTSWFVCGCIGLHIDLSLDDPTPFTPSHIWWILAGPFMLITAIAFAIAPTKR